MFDSFHDHGGINLTGFSIVDYESNARTVRTFLRDLRKLEEPYWHMTRPNFITVSAWTCNVQDEHTTATGPTTKKKLLRC